MGKVRARTKALDFLVCKIVRISRILIGSNKYKGRLSKWLNEGTAYIKAKAPR